jgi:hypothetical protein
MSTVIQKRWFRYRLWWLMGLIATLAILISPIFSPLDTVALSALLILVGTFFLLAGYVMIVALPYYLVIRRRRCPACGERRLFCSTLVLFRPPLTSLHFCHGCGSRYQRCFAGEWRGVQGPEGDGGPAATPVAEDTEPATHEL